jgi:hypothetical protein
MPRLYLVPLASFLTGGCSSEEQVDSGPIQIESGIDVVTDGQEYHIPPTEITVQFGDEEKQDLH